MPANMGVARRLEAANHRIDAAIAAIAPDSDPPAPSRNRGFAEVARAEWIADTLEGMATGQLASSGEGEQVLGGSRIDFSDWNDEQLASLATEVGIDDLASFKTRRGLIDAVHEQVDFDELIKLTSPQEDGDPASDEDPDPEDHEAGVEGGDQPTDTDLDSMTVEALRELASEREIEGRSGMKKAELIAALKEAE